MKFDRIFGFLKMEKIRAPIPPTRMEDETLKVIFEATQTAKGAFYIHVPTSGCPEGWLFVENLFRQKDGTVKPGCVLLKSIRFGSDFAARCDYLEPGEGFDLLIPMPPKVGH